jgi:hypothetical protein
MTFGYLWTLFIHICGTIDPGHTYDEYMVLLVKVGSDTRVFSTTRVVTPTWLQRCRHATGPSWWPSSWPSTEGNSEPPPLPRSSVSLVHAAMPSTTHRRAMRRLHLYGVVIQQSSGQWRPDFMEQRANRQRWGERRRQLHGPNGGGVIQSIPTAWMVWSVRWPTPHQRRGYFPIGKRKQDRGSHRWTQRRGAHHRNWCGLD